MRYEGDPKIHYPYMGSSDVVEPRNLEQYERTLGFIATELEGMQVLDLGAHKTELFSEQIKEKLINCHVVSLSPDFAFEKWRPDVHKRKVHSTVSAFAQSLPFRNNSFDRIFDYLGPSVHITDPQARKKFLLEVVRVLKTHGMYVTCVGQTDVKSYEEILNSIKASNNIDVIIQEVKRFFYRITIEKKQK